MAGKRPERGDREHPLTPLRCLRYAEQQFSYRTAIVCGNDRFSYGQFAERSALLGGALRQAGVKAGDRVAFLSLNCHRLLEAYYGVLEAGAVLLPLNIRLAPGELAFTKNCIGCGERLTKVDTPLPASEISCGLPEALSLTASIT